ncbi:Reverse transcriptase (RNA-dependent DNA polymerase) [Popillia japonica]|uniref:Reverse transcriptase (RNA-dependent DNA polymerase) n=1 Tax=Popillia japonica TaxID=7064 RepID=A0AAW1KKK0_POPJA
MKEKKILEEEIISRNKPEIEDIEKREQRVKQKPKWQQDYVMDFNQEDSEVLFALQVSQLDDVPLNYEDIESRKDKQLWRKAVEEEMKVLKESDTWEIKVLKESDTWEIVPKQKDMKLLDSKWVFTRKIVNDQSICKARLVVRGYQQQEHFDDVYSPVLRLQTLRILLSVAIHRNYFIHHVEVADFKNFVISRDSQKLLHPPDGRQGSVFI